MRVFAASFLPKVVEILENFWDKFPCFQLVFTAMQVVVDFDYRIAQCVLRKPNF